MPPALLQTSIRQVSHRSQWSTTRRAVPRTMIGGTSDQACVPVALHSRCAFMQPPLSFAPGG